MSCGRHRRYNFGWFRVADAQELKALCTDDFGRQHGLSIPPPLVRKDLIAEMRADADAELPPQFCDCVRHLKQPFFTPIFDYAILALFMQRCSGLSRKENVIHGHRLQSFGTDFFSKRAAIQATASVATSLAMKA
jgi:hypothetical protein